MRRFTLGNVDATVAGPLLPLLLEGLRLGVAGPRVGLGEREGREVRRQRRERVRVLLVAAAAGASGVRGSAQADPSSDGSSCFDSYAGSGCSGVSAGADPSVLAAGSFHIRGSRSANLPSSALDPHCSLDTARDAALFWEQRRVHVTPFRSTTHASCTTAGAEPRFKTGSDRQR